MSERVDTGQMRAITGIHDPQPFPQENTAHLPGARTRVVLDTSVLVADPACISGFSRCDVVIPLTVIEELDGLKSRADDVGRAARTALRAIEELRKRAGGSIHTPVPLGPGPDDATVHIEVNGVEKGRLIENGLDPAVPDNRIIGAAIGQSLSAPTKLISNDAGLRIKAAHMGLEAAEHHPVGRSLMTRPMGWVTCETPREVVDALYGEGAVGADATADLAILHENEFAVVRAGSQSALVRRTGDEVVLLPSASPEAW
ncbi:MAG: hypothetical protein RL383_1016, partial [Actinomycetota bacterium]